MAEICRVLLVTLLLYLFWLPSGLSEPDAEKSADSSAQMVSEPPMKGGPEKGVPSDDRNDGPWREPPEHPQQGGPKKVYPSDGAGNGDGSGGPKKSGPSDGAGNGDGSGFHGRGGKGGGDKSKDGDPPGYCRCNTAGRHVQSVVLGLFLLTFGVCLTWIEL